jgi:transcription elongation factor Elf1
MERQKMELPVTREFLVLKKSRQRPAQDTGRKGRKEMAYGQFIVPSQTRVECEFPCSGCGGKVSAIFPIKPVSHADETASCPHCGKNHYVTVMHDEGTGTIDVTGVDPQNVTAKGLA